MLNWVHHVRATGLTNFVIGRWEGSNAGHSKAGGRQDGGSGPGANAGIACKGKELLGPVAAAQPAVLVGPWTHAGAMDERLFAFLQAQAIPSYLTDVTLAPEALQFRGPEFNRLVRWAGQGKSCMGG